MSNEERKLSEIKRTIKKAKLNPRNNFDNSAKNEFLRINSDNRSGIFKYSDTSDKSMLIPEKGQHFEDGLFSFGLKNKDVLRKDFTRGKAIAAFGVSLNPLNQSSKTDMLNSLGLLTKSQKYHEKVNRAYVTRGMTSGMSLVFAHQSIEEGINPILNAAQFGVNSSIVFGGLRVGEGIGGIASTFVKSNSKKRLLLNAGRIGGLAGGLGVVAFSGIGDSISTVADSNNMFAKGVSDMFHSSQYASEFQSQETLTARQAALSKMSKAGINDRALILGSEALISRGIL